MKTIDAQRVAVVTGARRGIGSAIAQALAMQGWSIVAIDLVEDEAARSTLDAIRGSGAAAEFIVADIADVARSADVCQAAFDAFGRVDCLVNNAGVMGKDRLADVLHTTVDSFDHVMSVNLRGTFFLAQAFAREMVARRATCADAFQSIVTISSVNASHARTRAAEYSISKAAIAMFAKILALQLAPHGICCYDVQPGLIKTDLNVSLHEAYGVVIEEGGVCPMSRWGEPGDIACTVATLAGGGLPFATGQVLNVDGGMHIPKSAFDNPVVRARLEHASRRA
ncbi:3-ketoacyl-ACP reductase [Verticiella sediminum]|uniref:3-ketoacyl-ACP reductase n=1 Tax=Verticiella sediminum TaxID=1247510 RepID=A0A556ALY9_9BURK|nr:3-ketoacyl-ACP reductase [Verticiella sediminum]TSH93881.1 3-ketoacyl-ACP reductase [Verticiella sediminum]